MLLQELFIGGNTVSSTGLDVPGYTLTDNVAVVPAIVNGDGVDSIVCDTPVRQEGSLSTQEPQPDRFIHTPEPVFTTLVVESGTGQKFNRGFN